MNKQPETDEEWVEYLHKELGEVTGDTENDHWTADYVLIEFVKWKGYEKLAAAWEEVGKWYA